MKIAVTGKGGVGKTTVVGLLLHLFALDGHKVTGVDADPDSNLPQIFGIPEEKIVPLSEMKELISQRTGVKPGTIAPLFKLNPKVDDIPEKYGLQYERIKILVMGGLKKGGTGCYCPENALLGRLISHLLLQEEEIVILDMEAGIEHLSRGTSKFVDILMVVVEPTHLALRTALRIKKLAKDLGIKRVLALGNKIEKEEEKEFIASVLKGWEIIGFLPFDSRLKEANFAEEPLVAQDSKLKEEMKGIIGRIYIPKVIG
jgi:CO dehydrogenase maturation factor